MTHYLKHRFDLQSPTFIATYDELPLWSAPFGLMLLDKVPLAPEMHVLDIGCGTGFPLLELAQRLGNNSMLYGIDPWIPAIERAKTKAQSYGVNNVQFVVGTAEAMDFTHDFFDLVVSNLGINNFDDPARVLRECYRVLRPQGYLALTTNLRGHMSEFYEVFQDTLQELGLYLQLGLLQDHIEHRTDMESLLMRLQQAGFTISATETSTFRMRFLNGWSLLRHSFVRLAFLDAWKNIVPEEMQDNVFEKLEDNLNQYSRQRGELVLSIPCGYLEGMK